MAVSGRRSLQTSAPAGRDPIAGEIIARAPIEPPPGWPRISDLAAVDQTHLRRLGKGEGSDFHRSPQKTVLPDLHPPRQKPEFIARSTIRHPDLDAHAALHHHLGPGFHRARRRPRTDAGLGVERDQTQSVDARGQGVVQSEGSDGVLRTPLGVPHFEVEVRGADSGRPAEADQFSRLDGDSLPRQPEILLVAAPAELGAKQGRPQSVAQPREMSKNQGPPVLQPQIDGQAVTRRRRAESDHPARDRSSDGNALSTCGPQIEAGVQPG